MKTLLRTLQRVQGPRFTGKSEKVWPEKPTLDNELYKKRNTHERCKQEKEDKMETHDNRQLHKACRKGDLGRVKHILFQGSVDVNSRGEKHRKTPLMVAAQEGHVKIVHFLVRKGADVSLVDENGDNVLHMACRGGLMAIVKYIVKHNTVDINSKGMRGSTPLLQTVYCGYMDVFIFLVSKEANVSHVDDDGENILHLACRGGHEYMVRYVLEECSVDINSRGNNGETSLMKAASEGHIHVFGCLMSFGANRHLVDTDGDNILHHASIAGHGNMVVFIVTREMVDINSRGKYERTPLMRAAYYGHREICDLLVRFGGRMDLVDDKGHNILHLSALSGQVEMMKYILSLNTTDIDSRTQTGATPLMKAAYVGHKNVFEFLVSNGANVSHVDDRGDNILHHASFGGHTDMVQYILSQNLVNINSREKYGATPLMKAALMGHINVFEYLVRMKANVSQVDALLRELAHKNAKFHWGKAENRAFQDPKDHLTNGITVTYFDSRKPTVKDIVFSMELSSDFTSLKLRDNYKELCDAIQSFYEQGCENQAGPKHTKHYTQPQPIPKPQPPTQPKTSTKRPLLPTPTTTSPILPIKPRPKTATPPPYPTLKTNLRPTITQPTYPAIIKPHSRKHKTPTTPTTNSNITLTPQKLNQNLNILVECITTIALTQNPTAKKIHTIARKLNIYHKPLASLLVAVKTLS
ncbi:ankyrin repeat domain-containing protein 17-like [Haliotis asinina]|uniref:ankyrin repeat domain-containing protein 17-like n=1 Tax=Haliotis asinina TaxID=109174 RepID=UPI003531A288